jgi:hypothetical protein
MAAATTKVKAKGIMTTQPGLMHTPIKLAEDYYISRIHSASMSASAVTSSNAEADSESEDEAQTGPTRTRTRTHPLIAMQTVNIAPEHNSYDSPDSDQRQRQPYPYYYYSRVLQAEYAQRHGYDFYILTRPFRTPPSQGRSLHYQKILSTLHLLDINHPLYTSKKYDYVFWIDADTIITNFTTKLEDILFMTANAPSVEETSQKHVIISGDSNIICSAQVFWRNTVRTRVILQDLWDMYDTNSGDQNDLIPNYENGMLASMIGGCTPNHSIVEKVQCYSKMDFRDQGDSEKRQINIMELQIAAGNISRVPIASWALHDIDWVPKQVMNSYYYDWKPGDFIFHGVLRDKSKIIPRWFQKSIKINHLPSEAELMAKHNFTIYHARG